MSEVIDRLRNRLAGVSEQKARGSGPKMCEVTVGELDELAKSGGKLAKEKRDHVSAFIKAGDLERKVVVLADELSAIVGKKEPK